MTKVATKRNKETAPKPTRREVVTDEYGTGRFLCAYNDTYETITFGYEDGRFELTVEGYQTVVFEDFWLDVPCFAKAIEDKQIIVFRQNKVPLPRDTSVLEKFRLHDRYLDSVALAIVTKPEYDRVSKQQIFSAAIPMGGDLPDTEWLKNIVVTFLRNVQYREQKWRGRQALLDDIEKRLKEIADM